MDPQLDYFVDYINLRNIRFPLPLAFTPDAWNRPKKPQPAVISLRVAVPRSLIKVASEVDDTPSTLNYSALYRRLESAIRTRVASATAPDAGEDGNLYLGGLIDLCEEAARAEQDELLSRYGMERAECLSVETVLYFPKAVLRAAGGLRCVGSSTGRGREKRECTIENIRCYCIIGINEHERLEKQAVDITLVFNLREGRPDTSTLLQRDYPRIARSVADAVDASAFKTVEALATEVARIVIVDFHFAELTVRAEKPSALAFVEHSGVEMTRTADYFAIEKKGHETSMEG
ncbi:predicted protein [Uncinocarpus reesii 1704]|uniref:dihydroneopterin aldolase n=1 Tax=Uncinocarpus reesii (strain UAMH 1704) TaxID=336963 RepID=C4JYU6_UNCRE|nr:uncharacterized protein UREG_07347 [Uncinocarpus reesii 1704]EEP82482.1 predicted protein [Uncinocarpus reesii 1704]